MKYITGNNRNQMQFFTLEEYIHQENEVRLIDLFVDSLDLQQFGFKLNLVIPDGHLITPKIYSDFIFMVISIEFVLQEC